MQYHEVKINVEFESVSNLWSGDNTNAVPSLGAASLWVDYIYLDADERRRFAQVSHEYLIEQLQYTGQESTTTVNPKLKLNFNHPCKELVWTVSKANATVWNDFTDGTGGPVASAKLQLNGHDRFAERQGSYFNLVQPYQHHENVPKTGVYVYSFALQPESHQPSGTCNMSRIDNATLQLTLTPASVAGTTAVVNVYAVNYNVNINALKSYQTRKCGSFSCIKSVKLPSIKACS